MWNWELDQEGRVREDLELWEAFKSMAPELQDQLASKKISFWFNPPGEFWWVLGTRGLILEGLRVTLQEQMVPEPVLFNGINHR